MANEINGIRPGTATTPVAEQNTQRAAAKESGTQAPANSAKTATDNVSLSSSAQALKTLEQKIQKFPEVNEKRVAQIKAALESGEYKVDDLVVADKLLKVDDLLR